jgi:serine/threonine protein kinase
VAEVKKLAGLRYQILRPHDKGGIGEVFVALDQELNRQVALKEIQERHAGDMHSCGRFVREAEITGGLEHPGIVPVYGPGQYADGRPFYAMRFIQGETLKDAIDRYHRSAQSGARSPEFELRGLLTRFIAVCNAIAYAHSRGVIHCDLKPSNIMLGKYGETLVVDWGMAKAGMKEAQTQSASDVLPEPSLVPNLGDAIETQAGAAIGTPAYMSPEQASGRLDLLGPTSDIYGLGATLYTLLTGRPAIEGRDTAEVLRKAQRGEWLPARQLKPDVPPALAAICQKAMAASPSARYATALDLAADVEHWLADEPVSSYRESWATRSRRWMRRHRTLVSTAIGALIIALLSATAGLVIISEAWDKEATARKTAVDQEKETQKQKDEADRQRDEARFNQMAGGWPRPAMTKRCVSGTPPAERSCLTSKGIGERSMVCRSARTVGGWPRPARTRQCVSGTPLADRSCSPSRGTPAKSMLCASARTVGGWPRPARTRQCVSGMLPPDKSCLSLRGTRAAWSSVCRSARTVGGWPRQAGTTRCVSGTPPPDRSCLR